MTTLKLHPSTQWTAETSNEKQLTFWNKLTAFADGEAKHRTGWFLLSLIVQGVFFLPVPAILLYYFNAPIVCLAITMVLFFANVILGMSGAGIHTLIFCFGLSIVVNLGMLIVFMI